MGLGPNGSSLLERLGRPTEPPVDASMVEMEQMERTEQRKAARVRYALKHKAKVKPLAPVEQVDHKGLEGKRIWTWQGEDIASKTLFHGCVYTSERIRKEGFKLPKLKKEGKKNESISAKYTD